jgi:hypothetical protein
LPRVLFFLFFPPWCLWLLWAALLHRDSSVYVQPGRIHCVLTTSLTDLMLCLGPAASDF